GPSIRFQGIELEFSSYAGCQFDIAKNGCLVLSLEHYSGTVVLRSARVDSTPSDSYSLGGDPYPDMDLDLALSQLEQESPKAADTPSDVRYSCEGRKSPVSFSKKESPARASPERRTLSVLVSPAQPTTTDIHQSPASSPAPGAPKRSAAVAEVTGGGQAVSPDTSSTARVIPKRARRSGVSSKKTGGRKAARTSPTTIAAEVSSSWQDTFATSRHLPEESEVLAIASSVSESLKAEQTLVTAKNDSCAPMGRWGHSATMISDSRMLVLGGQADDDAHEATLGDLYKFDFVTEKWSRPVNCDSVPRAWHTASFLEGKNLLVIFGGERTVDGCPECLDDIMVLDTDIDLFYPPAISGKPPAARSGHSAAVIGKDLVVFGGVRGRKWQNKISVLDTERWHWRHPTIDGSAPAPRSYHSATVVGELMVVIGGNNQNESFDKVHVLDTRKSRWEWITPVVVGVGPSPRTGHAALLLDDGKTIMLHGGWDPEDEGGVRHFEDAFLLDTELWEWKRGPVFDLGAGAA
ncbi:unnamed protein product, partial [Choristocarpus tenellus]